MSLLVAIDQSTSATKALLIDASGTVVDAVSRDHRQFYPRPGWVEHDAAEIFANVLATCGELAARNRGRFDEVRGVSLTNQRETFVVLDRASGQPLRPAIVWQCRRGDALCDELRANGADALVAQRTGLKLDSYFSGPKIAWLLQNDGPVRQAIHGGHAAVATIDAYLVHRLTEGRVFATDSTNASRTLLFDVERLVWDEELCRLFEVSPSALPEVRESSSRFGETDLGGALPQRVPLVGVMGDSQASLFAQGCYAIGEAKATFGTGTSLLVNRGAQLETPPQGAVSALAWAEDGRPTYAWEGLINYAAATIVWLRDQLGLLASMDEVEPLASSVDDAGGVYVVPAFAGMGAPYWRPEARGAIVGLSAHSTRAHVVRAAVESIAYQVADLLGALDTGGSAGRPLKADGGATRNTLLMQLVADLTQRPVEATHESNLSAVGAAMSGMLGLGWVRSLEELRALPRPVTRYEPQIDPTVADDRLAQWRAAVNRVF